MSEAWVRVGKYWRVPCKSDITQARQRLGARVMSDLFHQLVRPMATTETLGAFLNLPEVYELSIVLYLNFNVLTLKICPFFRVVDHRDSGYIVT